MNPSKTFKEISLLASAAYRVNQQFDGGLVRTGKTTVERVLGRTTDKTPPGWVGLKNGDPWVWCNSELILHALADWSGGPKNSSGRFFSGMLSGKRTVVTPLEVTSEDEALAAEIYNWCKTLSWKAVSGKINDFERAVFVDFQSDSITGQKQVARIAALPKSVARDLERRATKQRYQKLAPASRYLGAVRDRIRGMEVEIISHYRVRTNKNHIWSMDRANIVNCVDTNGNLIAFFTGKTQEEFGKRCVIDGTIKRNKISKYHGGEESFLTRVNIRKVIE